MSPGKRPLFERQEVLSTIASAAGSVMRGSGRMLIVESGAGLGKTSVISAAVPLLGQAGFTVLRARGSDLERAFPYGVVRQLLERPLLDPDVRESVMVGAARGAETVLGGRGTGGSDTRLPLPPAAEPFQVLHGLYWTVANLCDVTPVAFVVDDAHDADPETLRFFSYLAARIIDLRLFMLVATRPADQATDPHLVEGLHSLHPGPVLSLPPLSPEAVRDAIAHHLGRPPAEMFSATVSAATGGNPFYLGELLSEVAERRLSPTAENAPTVGGMGPRRIVRSLLFRLTGVPAALPVARACAILGDGARLSDVARLAGVDIAVAAAAADGLITARILAPGQGVRFAHPIVEAAILADIGTNELSRWHAKAADLLLALDADPQIVGLHLLRTDPDGNQSWVEALRRAGRTAARSGTPEAAAGFLQRALAEPPDADTLPEVRFELGVVLASKGMLPGIALMAQGISATRDVRQAATRSVLLADYQMRSGDIPAAVATLDDSLVRLGDADPDLALDIEIERYWSGHLQLGVLSGVEEIHRRLLRIAEGPDDALRRRLWCYLTVDAARVRSREEAWHLGDRALAPPGPLTCLPSESTAVSMLAFGLEILERFAEFDTLVDDVLAAAARSGQQVGHLLVATFQAQAALNRGRLPEAEHLAAEAVRSSTMRGWGHGAPATSAILAAARLEQGRVEDAIAALQPFALDEPNDYPTGLLATARGRIRLETGDPAGGLADLLTAGRAMTELGATNPGMIDWRVHAVRALLALGRRPDAAVLARESLELARRMSGPIAVGTAVRVMADTADGAAHLDLLEEAIDVLRPTQGHLQLARALLATGSALRRAGYPRDARSPLQEAFDLATDAHALPMAEQARGELLVSGARPRRRSDSPVQLTASEARVARLALHGMSNKAIAQALYLSRKTVEKHLASTYRKLQISSRRELDSDRLVAAVPDEE